MDFLLLRYQLRIIFTSTTDKTSTITACLDEVCNILSASLNQVNLNHQSWFSEHSGSRFAFSTDTEPRCASETHFSASWISEKVHARRKETNHSVYLVLLYKRRLAIFIDLFLTIIVNNSLCLQILLADQHKKDQHHLKIHPQDKTQTAEPHFFFLNHFNYLHPEMGPVKWTHLIRAQQTDQLRRNCQM